MFIAIISDIHDNLANLDKCLSWCRNHKIEKILCCGDMTTGETAAWLAANFNGEIFVIRGNIELYRENDLDKCKNIRYCGELGIIELGGLHIGLCHEPEKISELSEIAPQDLNFIFYGHTHKPWLSKHGSAIVVNPGNIAGTFHQATFATLDTATEKLELKLVADL